MSTTSPEGGAPVPPGYQPGDYVPFKDRDPSNPSSVAGQWADPARDIQMGGVKLSAEEQFRAIYGNDVRQRTLTYAGWFRRVLGYLVDLLFSTFASIPLIVGYVMLVRGLDMRTDPVTGEVVSGPDSQVSNATVLMLVFGATITLVFFFWNSVFRQGSTGYTVGKTVVGIRLVRLSTGEPIGAGMSFLRQLAHYIDSLACYLGWLWPLWDPKKQTLADKIVGSVVVVQRQEDVGS